MSIEKQIYEILFLLLYRNPQSMSDVKLDDINKAKTKILNIIKNELENERERIARITL